MGTYIKKFDTDSEYQEYINGENALLPNVSACANESHIHYNPVEPEESTVVRFEIAREVREEWDEEYEICDEGI